MTTREYYLDKCIGTFQPFDDIGHLNVFYLFKWEKSRVMQDDI